MCHVETLGAGTAKFAICGLRCLGQDYGAAYGEETKKASGNHRCKAEEYAQG